MIKLDRTAFSTSKVSDSKKESDNYTNQTVAEKHFAFAYLQSVAYNFPIFHYPKMDRTCFATRTLNG